MSKKHKYIVREHHCSYGVMIMIIDRHQNKIIERTRYDFKKLIEYRKKSMEMNISHEEDINYLIQIENYINPTN